MKNLVAFQSIFEANVDVSFLCLICLLKFFVCVISNIFSNYGAEPDEVEGYPRSKQPSLSLSQANHADHVGDDEGGNHSKVQDYFVILFPFQSLTMLVFFHCFVVKGDVKRKLQDFHPV